MKRYMLSCLWLLLSLPLHALGQGERITVSGTIRLVGNEPFTQYVLVADEGTVWFLPDPFMKKHPGLSGKKVSLEGIPETKKLVTADRKRTIIRQWLNKPRLTGGSREN